MEAGPQNARIWQYLGELGWPHDQVADNVICAQYAGHFGAIKVMLQTNGFALRMAINPVLDRPVDGWGRSVNRLIKMLNEEAHLIRVGMDREGDIYVKVDVPVDGMNYDQFVYVLFNLCQVSEQLLVPVLQAQAYDTYSPVP